METSAKKTGVGIIFFTLALVFSSMTASAQEISNPMSKLNPTVLPGPQLTVNYQITNQRKPTITGSINNSQANVYVLINKHTFKGVNSGDGTWAAGIDEILPDGAYDVTVIATPPEGNRVIMSVAKAVTIDTVAPKASVKNQAINDSGSKITGTTDDDTALIVINIDGSFFSADNNGDTTWELPYDMINPPLEPGTYTITAYAADLAGNISNGISAKLTVTIASDKKHEPSENQQTNPDGFQINLSI